MARARLLVIVLAIAALVGTTIQDELSGASPAIRRVLQPLRDHGFDCTAEVGHEPWPYPQWQCHRTDHDVHRFIVVDTIRDQVMGVMGGVEQETRSPLDPALAAEFLDQVASLPRGTAAEPIRHWVASHLTQGGRVSEGPIRASLNVGRSWTYLSLSASGLTVQF